MTVVGALNLVWVLAAVSALGFVALRERRRRARLRDRFRRACAVLLAAVALFPCISASDDFVRFGQMSPNTSSAGAVVAAAVPDGSSEGRTVHLAQLLQILDSFQLSAAAWLLVTLCFCFLFLRFAEIGPERNAPGRSSRAPPVFSFSV